MNIPGFGPEGLLGFGHSGTHILLIIILLYLIFFTAGKSDDE